MIDGSGSARTIGPRRPAASPPGPAAQGQPAGDQPGRPQLAEVARGGALNIGGAIVSAAATLGTTVVITRHFSKVTAGAFFTATSAFMIVETIAALGAYVGLVYFIARLRSFGEGRRIPVMIRAAIVPVTVTSVIATASLLLFAQPLAHVLLAGHVGRGGASPAHVADALRALGVTLPFAAWEDTYLGVTRGYRDMRPTVMVDKVSRSLLQLLGVLIAAAVGGTALLAPLWALPYIPAGIVAWWWSRRIRLRSGTARRPLPDLPPELAALLALATPMDPADVLAAPVPAAGGTRGGRATRRQLADANPRGFWRFTTPRAIANFASIMLQRIDIVLVAILKGPAEAAVYTAATRFLVVGQIGSMAIATSAQPRFTELFALNDRRGANVIYRVTTAWLILLTWPLYLLAIIYGPQVLAVFGHSYKAGAAVMVILGFSMLFSAVCGQVDVVLITAGRSSWSLANGLLALGINIGLDLILIPRDGITGAAIGWAVAIVVANLVPLCQLAAVFRLHPLGRSTGIACALSAVCFGALPLLLHAVAGGGIKSLAAGVAAGTVLYLAGLWRFSGPLRLAAMPGLSFLSRGR